MSSAMSVLLLVSLLILTITAQGIRLEKESLAAFHNRINNKAGIKGAKGDGPDEEYAFICIGEQCSGKARNLMTKTMITPKRETSKETIGGSQRHHGGKTEGKHAEFPEDLAPGVYPDMVDVEGMDYSPAKRKPPIHN